MKVKVSKTLSITCPDWADTKELILIRDNGVSVERFVIKCGEMKDLRQALHAIETCDLTDEEKSEV